MIYFNSKSFPLPRGEHGRQNAEIQMLQVRKMVRHLGIDKACANRHIEGLDLQADPPAN